MLEVCTDGPVETKHSSRVLGGTRFQDILGHPGRLRMRHECSRSWSEAAHGLCGSIIIVFAVSAKAKSWEFAWHVAPVTDACSHRAQLSRSESDEQFCCHLLHQHSKQHHQRIVKIIGEGHRAKMIFSNYSSVPTFVSRSLSLPSKGTDECNITLTPVFDCTSPHESQLANRVSVLLRRAVSRISISEAGCVNPYKPDSKPNLLLPPHFRRTVGPRPTSHDCRVEGNSSTVRKSKLNGSRESPLMKDGVTHLSRVQ